MKIEALGTLASLENQTSAIQVLNENVDKLEAALENTVSRNGSAPNTMEAPLDMNGSRILNLPAPAGDNDPVRLTDLNNATIFAGEVILPDQTGNDYKLLSTTGTNLIWITASLLPGIGDMKAVNNLSEVNAVGARTNLGLGTAATRNTGTSGGVVPLLSSSATWSSTQTWQATNTLSGDIVVDGLPTSAKSVGFRGSPIYIKTTDWPLVLGDAGATLHFNEALGKIVTITKDVIPVGHFVNILNLGTGAISIQRAVDVSLAKLGLGGDGNVSLSQWGMATLYHYATNQWFVWGTNVT